MAEAIVKGLVGKLPANTSNSSTDSSEKLYAVCVGAWKDKDTADRVLSEVKSKGYKDAYLIPR